MAEPNSFPDVRWGSGTGRFRTVAIAFAATKVGSTVIRRMTKLDRKVLERSRGRFTALGPIGAPMLLLNTTGATSGKRRTTPLIYHREGDRLFVVASNFGQAHHPAWSGNLLKHPDVSVTMGGKEVPVRATPLAGPERDRVWGEFTKLAHVYDVYRGRTTREIRVFALDLR